MPFKYYTCASPINFNSTGDQILAEFQANVDAEFAISPSYYTITEEIPFASGSYIDVGARVNTAISSETGVKLGDDFKKIIFQDLDHDTSIGYKYYFDDNYYIAMNTRITKSFVSSVTVRRCNNVLRWTDTDGNSLSSHCVIDYSIKRPSDSVGATNPVTPEGFIIVYTQLNDDTKTIVPGQRFLFGNSDNWQTFKIFGNGIRSFLNQDTEDNDSCKLLMLEMGANAVNNDTDDVVNGIADTYKNVYELTLIPSSISGSVGDTFQISANLEINGISVTKDLSYMSSASSIATISGSGGVILVANGSTDISISVTENSSASAVCSVVVSASSVAPYEIRVSPANTTILEGTTTIFETFGYVGGNVQAEKYTFAIANSNVPGANYTLATIDDNSFSVQNIEMYLAYPLIISATSGSYTEDISIDLRGAW